MDNDWPFTAGAFGVGYSLAKTINSAVKKHKLNFTSIIRLGPRFFIALLNNKKSNYLLKTSILHLGKERSDDPTIKNFIREIHTLTNIQKSHNHTLSESIPFIIDANYTGFVWQLRRYSEGERQSVGESVFLFRSAFFTNPRIDWLIKFFGALQQETRNLPATIKRKLEYYNLKDYENFTNWKQVLQQLKFGSWVTPLQKFIDSKRKAFDRTPKVLTHREPYASHFIHEHTGKMQLIDWENIGLGNQVHDLSVIWLRAYKNRLWQQKLFTLLQNKIMPNKNFPDIFSTETVIQALGNLFFFTSRKLTKEEQKEKKNIIPYLTKILKDNIKK